MQKHIPTYTVYIIVVYIVVMGFIFIYPFLGEKKSKLKLK